MKQFHNLLKNILDNGFTHGDRTGVGRRSIYNVHLDFEFQVEFTILLAKRFLVTHFETLGKNVIYGQLSNGFIQS